MRTIVRKFIKHALDPFSMELRRKHEPIALLRTLNLMTIIDGGANDGGFASECRGVNSTATIHSFEPVPWICEKLKNRFALDPRFHAYNLALGDVNSDLKFEINSDQYSSSLLPMRPDAGEIFPGLNPTATVINVCTTTLDSWAAGMDLPRPLLLKLDLEGGELAALRGSLAVLQATDYVLIEIAFMPLRDGQPTFREIAVFLEERGFEIVDVYPGMQEKRSGRAIWADVLFERKERQRG